MQSLKLCSIFKSKIWPDFLASISRSHVPRRNKCFYWTVVEHLVFVIHLLLDIGIAPRGLEDHVVFTLESRNLIQFLLARLVVIIGLYWLLGHVLEEYGHPVLVLLRQIVSFR